MQRKTAFLVCALATMMTFNQAYASHPHTGAGLFEVTSADGNYKIGVHALLQTRLGYDQDLLRKSPETNYHYGFSLPRARVGLYGNAFDPALTYLIQLQFENSLGRMVEKYRNMSAEDVQKKIKGAQGPMEVIGKLGDELESTDVLSDYSVNWAFSQEYFHLAVGKFVVPYARQQVMSAAKYQFPDPNTTNKAFGLPSNGRGIGFMLHNGFNNPFEYALAIVNHGIGARIGYNYNGIDGYDAVDFLGGDLRFGLGLSGYAKTDYKSAKFNDIKASADLILKAYGFSTNAAFYYDMKKEGEEKEYTNKMGATIDLGYLIAEQYEPVLRYDWSQYNKNQHDILAGFNYYIFGHNLKTQLYGGTSLFESKFKNVKAGLQLQFAL